MTGSRPQRSVRRLCRVTRHNPATTDDFRSYRALGLVSPRRRGTRPDSADKVSTLITVEKARRYARAFDLGDWIAVLVIPPDAPIEIGKVSPSGHVDLLGDPEAIAATVDHYVPVDDPGVQ